MPWAAGSYTKGNAGTGGWTGDASLGIGIEAGRHDTQDNDFATGINQCINKDGSNAFTGDANLGGFRPTNIAAGTAAAPALCVGGDVNTGVFGPAADTWAVATNGVERMRVDSSGNVGIGGSPTQRLSVISGSGVAAYISLRGDGASTANDLLVGQSATANGLVAQQSTDKALDLVCGANVYNSNGAAIRLQSNTSGRDGTIFFSTNQGGVGSAERFQISNAGVKSFSNGSIFIAATAIASGAGTNAMRYSTSTGIVTYDTSSRLIKTDIVDCPKGLNAVLALQPRKYFRTDDQKEELGFIADEMELVIPELVSYAEKSRFTKNEEDTETIPSAIAYEKLSAVLCKAIQELNAKVEALQARVDELEGA